MSEIVPSISANELESLRKTETICILDIREAHEVTVSRITEFNIPMAFTLARQAEIPRDIPVVIYCRSGARSAATVSALMTKHGFTNLKSLEGGITAWAQQVEPGMEVA